MTSVIEAYLARIFDAWVEAGFHPSSVAFGFDPSEVCEDTGQALPWLVIVEGGDDENFKIASWSLEKGLEAMLEYSVSWRRERENKVWD